LAAKLSGRLRAGARPGIEDLTDREMQVFELIGRGMSRKRIAERLKLDVNTVETYRTRIRERLQLPDAEALREFAVNAKLEGKY
ncbi:MAG: LuxR family transcriptional regulator, partial [Verrucomicrobia bacterium]